MKVSSTFVVSTVLAMFLVTIRAHQPASVPDGTSDPTHPADVVDSPDKPTWAYAVAPGAPIAGAPRAGQPARGVDAAGGGPQGARAGGSQSGRAAGGRGGPDPTPRSLPGSKYSFSMAEVRNAFAPADWFPEDHPAMPDIVAHGRQPNVRACAFCHMPNGKGRPENGPVAGLPKEYIVQQLRDYKSGARKTAEPRKPNDMGNLAPFMTDKDMEDAAEYFASMPWTQWIRVVEADTIKKTRVQGQMYHLVEDAGTEPIGVRVVEAPEDESLEALRAPRTGFVAYVPVGAIMKGEDLVTTGGGKTIPCGTCHGPELKGIGTIPGLAGRSPSYLGRQLWDFKSGTRNGTMAALMKPVVEKLTNEDIVNILAYTASRKP
jgi:cytochrome c553